jgi:hypothetical protein
MEAWRFVFYGGAFLLALIDAALFLRVRNTLARMLALTWAIWSANALILALNLAELLIRGSLPGWGHWLFTANAFLLLVGPAVMLLWFMWWQNGGRDGR